MSGKEYYVDEWFRNDRNNNDCWAQLIIVDDKKDALRYAKLMAKQLSSRIRVTEATLEPEYQDSYIDPETIYDTTDATVYIDKFGIMRKI